MKIYSHSRLSTFEQCPLKFKLKYIDKLKPEIERSIEAHLGGVVHEVLEWLYTEVKNKKLPSLDHIIKIYAEKWQETFTPEILIVKQNKTIQDYFNKGVQFLIDYYTKNKPFDDNTLETEKKIEITLDDSTKLIGFIDRLVHNLETQEYEVHDYKTANSMPLKEQIENDRQLALYSIAIKEIFGQDKEVKLVWHYLAHNQKITSTRTQEQLTQLKEDTLELIKKIESTKEFPANKSILCNWCEYKNQCPIFNTQKNLDIW